MVLQSISNEMNALSAIKDLMNEGLREKTWNHAITVVVTSV